MATSQNGWPVIPTGADPRLVAIPKIAGRVRAGDVATVLAYLVARFDAEVEDVDAGADDWGYAYRPIAGKDSGFSNHASGTAIDLNATQHPLAARGTFTLAQTAALRRILAVINRDAVIVRWGGDYTGRADEMHFEIVGTPAQVAAAAARLRGQLVTNPITQTPGGGGGAPSVTAPTPLVPEEDIMASRADLQADLAAAIAPVLAAVAAGGPRAYRIVGTDAAYLDLGVARRGLTGGQDAIARVAIGELAPTDPFWQLELVGPVLQAYRRAGDSAVYYVLGGELVYVDAARYAADGSPALKDLPTDHPIWALPVRAA